ncbi:1,4-alpha-glucan branching protein GlgB [methanotrophic endosymbiont of Bathymodiolus puteoserpentis (Logatchev)]|jgi:1,4-alpha-glucan branching enzyme|uniref:1,4-alpha-glucan branching protein GlgB n=1 Tax=methanotrophic endosymbiont of Bathymodiolus puteoserpentis (Logatchev) TaxID=343235 RepID=UPI0013C638B0|nr:1,4-alpha-glucan branching protein GlgB [methanotrophic endosymbiont of Bathymodiolus puteoserpentis (Logatchev)]SHE21575.1 1,4-alpha-glucan (glycogen) branching enzyme, GH-13-type [methanotrophic endosymbiont of Bathymodiolus puteoserpentis (Logatchev)]
MNKLNKPTKTNPLDSELLKISEAKHHDPFSILGRHKKNGKTTVTVYLPYVETVEIAIPKIQLQRIPDTDFFQAHIINDTALPQYYQLKCIDKAGNQHTQYDPYSFGSQLPEFDQHLFSEGRHWHIYKKLGAHLHTVDNIEGVLFTVWAPNAGRVSVISEFNSWDGRCHPMRILGGSGIWEIFIPGVEVGCLYKYEILNRNTNQISVKTDPYAQQFEFRPQTASVVVDEAEYTWNDDTWMTKRPKHDWLHEAMSTYEVHLGSWKRDAQGNFLNYRDLAHELVDYVTYMGFTHIELLPITEHPLDASWGYQTTGYFAPTSRHGSSDDFRYFIDYCHQHNISIILDWVPAHFPKDDFALARFDGSALYEHEDPRKGEHRDWGTLIYNYSRNEVRNFLLSSAYFWLEEFHLDGLRVDAVASMLYLDYSREEDDWVPNQYGGNENLEAIDFLRELNTVTHEQHPGTVVIAEESTSWPQVTRPTWTGGLGFSMKWNMGWMHDILSYMQQDPIHRRHHHDQLTFGMLYAFTENFMLPFSHDEVVHGKGSMLNKMPGDEWQKFANLRLLYTFMFTYPGKKLLFMGCDIAQGTEWNFNQSLDWYVLDYSYHKGIQTLVKDLNKLYVKHPALFQHDFDNQGFEWIDCHDVEQSVISFTRKTEQETLIVILNFTPVPRENYRIGVPRPGTYHEIFNSDSEYYAGSNTGNGYIVSEDTPWMNQEQSLNLTIPPLAGIVLKL